MERIKEAIAKARARRRGETIPLSEPAEGPESESEGEKEKGKEGRLRRVRYRQTRVVELDQDHLAENRIFAHNKNSPLTSAIDLLRTQVLHKMEEHGWRTLAVTSPTAASGKTMVAINLAMSIARHTQKTSLLVDFDLRRPKVAQYLGLKVRKYSLISALKGKVTLPEVMVNPGIRHLVVVPTAKPVANPAEALASKKVELLIKDLRSRYESRIVIFDLAPLLSIDDAIGVLPKIDCVLMVVGDGMSTRREVEEGLRLLQAHNLLGVVLNKADEEFKPAYY